MEKAKVYFSKEISPEKVLEMYKKLGINLPGKLAVKVHSGEEGNQNFLRPEFWKPVIDELHGTVVECNTAYPGKRNTTKKHTKLMEKHGWSKVFDVDIMDSEGDVDLDIEGGKHLKKNRVGKHMMNYDSLLVLSHFKGHPMGGYGGALKQLSIGCASSAGKCWIHSGGRTHRQGLVWLMTAPQEVFLECMAESASTVVKHFEGKCAFINVMCNMSVDCDCCSVAEDPCMKDIGILASTDPIAIDQACLDLVYKSDDPGRDHLLERIESRKGVHTIEAADMLGYGTREYDLIEI